MDKKLTFEQECSLIANGEDLLKDKEMIEEMAKEFKQCLPKDWFWLKSDDADAYLVAKHFYNKGYRKLPKDSVMLSREEYDCLKKIEKAYDPFWFCAFGGCEGACKECKDTCEMSIFVKERKETAEKFRKELRNFTIEITSWGNPTKEDVGRVCQKIFNEIMKKADEIAKQFGVEIKV